MTKEMNGKLKESILEMRKIQERQATDKALAEALKATIKGIMEKSGLTEVNLTDSKVYAVMVNKATVVYDVPGAWKIGGIEILDCLKADNKKMDGLIQEYPDLKNCRTETTTSYVKVAEKK